MINPTTTAWGMAAMTLSMSNWRLTPVKTNSIAVVLGTRPEIIKLAPVISELGAAARVIHTGQHYDSRLSKVFFDAFALPEPTERLEIGGKSRGSQIGEATSGLDALFADPRPDAVVVQGDTNTVLAASLAANAREIPLVHVEAGLRSHDRRMPEEHNRVVADHLSDLCLAPTETAHQNLLSEGIPDFRTVVTGNTVVEALNKLLPTPGERKRILEDLSLTSKAFCISTIHRPENVDNPETFEKILRNLSTIGIPVVLPLHPRSRLRAKEAGLDHLLQFLVVTDPLDYRTFLALLAESALAIADSGGIQEEVSVLKRPLIVVRRSTERPEVLGTFATLVEPGDDISQEARKLLADIGEIHSRLASIPSPYGDGSASAKSVAAIQELLR